MDRSRSIGFVEAAVSSASFGLIPLFTLPVLSAGMPMPSLLVYRYIVACVIMLAILAMQRTRLRIRYGEMLRIAWLALLYDGSAVFLFSGYAYLPSGVATALLFTYPIFATLAVTRDPLVAGMLVMAWNAWRTAMLGKPVSAPIPRTVSDSLVSPT